MELHRTTVDDLARAHAALAQPAPTGYAERDERARYLARAVLDIDAAESLDYQEKSFDALVPLARAVLGDTTEAGGG